MGRWRIEATERTYYLTLSPTLEAKATNVPWATLKWEIVGDEVRVVWSHGWRNVILPRKSITTAFEPGKGWADAPTSIVRAVQESGDGDLSKLLPPAIAPDGYTPFVGGWYVGEPRGTDTFHFTLGANRETRRSDRRDLVARWEVVGGEARMDWGDGWRDVIRTVPGGFVKAAYAPGVSYSAAPTNTEGAVKNVPPKPATVPPPQPVASDSGPTIHTGPRGGRYHIGPRAC